MEEEKHLTEQKRPKSFTRSEARHLRRKRLKEARRAEKQLFEPVNGVNNNSDKETTNGALKENNKTKEIELKSNDLKNLSKISQSSYLLDSSKTEGKTQNHCVDHKVNNIEIEKTKLETIDVDLEHCLNHCPSQISQISNSEKVKPTNNATLKENSLNAPSVSSTFNDNVNYPVVSTLDSVKNLTENYKNFKSNDLFDVVDSAQDDTEIKNNHKLRTNATDNLVNCTSINNGNKNDIINKNDIQTSVISDIKENTNVFSQKLISSNKMADGKLSLPEKTREEIKAEREAKRAAKAAAKAAKTKNKTIETDNTENKLSTTTNSEISEKKSVNTDVVNTQSSGLAKETRSEKNAVQSSTIQQSGSNGKSKAELRAERRAKQESQRAAKLHLQQSSTHGDIPRKKPITVVETYVKEIKTERVSLNQCSKAIAQVSKKEDTHEINLFKHLYQERVLSFFDIALVNSRIHPAVVRLGVRYESKTIVGSNARCVALLAAVKQMIEDYEKPSQVDFTRGLETNLEESLAYLHHCRPLAVSMRNAMRYLKWQMMQLPATLSDNEAKNKLKCAIDIYIAEQIYLAKKAISITIQSKISNGDVILIYGHSSVIYNILVEAYSTGKQFRVIVVDGRPWLEGKEQIRRLVKLGIECSYVLINALSFVMSGVNKVFLGAHAIFANGAVMSRVGTSQIALIAKAFNVPVLVACETHKSSERVQTDSIVYNELGNADELVRNSRQSNNSKKPLLTNWRSRKYLNLLNITYDVTPADLITAVVTELAIVPCTSVPVILRIKPTEI